MMNHSIAWAPLVLLAAAAVHAEDQKAAHPTQTGSPRKVLAADYQKKIIALVDEDNDVLWQAKIGSIHDLHVLDNGNVLMQTTFQNVIEMTPTGKTVWMYETKMVPKGQPGRVEIHAFQRLADGTTMIAESGPGRIIEVDRNGKVTHEVKLTIDNPNPHRDTRLVRKLDNGNYLVCHEGDLKVREYNRDGRVVWTYDAQARIYSAERLASGNTLIGCGDGHRVVEVNRAGEVVWSVEENELPGIKLAWITMVDRLAGGNTLIVNCHAGPENPQIIEVDRNKDVVWSFQDFHRFGNALPVARVLP